MARIGVPVAIVMAFALAGCTAGNRDRAVVPDETCAQQTIPTALDRLRSENLPALLSVEPWNHHGDPGLKLVTDHYEIFTTVQQPLILRTVPGFVESAYRGYNEQLAHPIETSRRFTIYLFADRRQWEDFTRSFAGEQASLFCKIQTGAYYLNGACVVYDIGPRRTLAALGHEGWHQFNTRHFKYRLPSWLDEGVAMLFETSVCEHGLFRFDPSANVQRLGSLKETLCNSRQLSLQDLIATSPGEVLATDQAEAVMAFYSQSYALARFLRESDYGRRLSTYRRLLYDGLVGNWPLDDSAQATAENRNVPRTIPWNRTVGTQLFRHYVASDIEQLDREYVAFCRRLVSGLSFAPVEEDDRYAAR